MGLRIWGHLRSSAASRSLVRNPSERGRLCRPLLCGAVHEPSLRVFLSDLPVEIRQTYGLPSSIPVGMQKNGKAERWHPTSSDFTSVPEMLTAKDLETLLKIDAKTIYSYVQKRLIPYVRIQSNVRFIRHQIAEWIEGKTVSPRPMNGDSSNTR